MPSRPSNLKRKPEPKPSKTLLQFEALGTAWEIIVPAGITPELEQSIHSTLERVDKTWSRFRNDSLVADMAKSAGHYPLALADRELLAWYEQLYAATDSHVTPLIGQTISDAGYDARYSLQPKASIARTPSWHDCLRLTADGVDILQPCLLDVGAAGKGFAIDQVTALLGASYLVDAGGDIRLQALPQIIGLEDPRDTSSVIGTMELANGSLCGSAGNRRTWGESNGRGAWHHILDPKTSRPVDDVLATWVVASTAMVADGLATALFFIAPERLQKLARFDYVIMHADGSVMVSDTSKVHLFTK